MYVDYIEKIVFFQLWCEACSFSKIFFHENQHFWVFFDHLVIFLHFFEVKKRTELYLIKLWKYVSTYAFLGPPGPGPLEVSSQPWLLLISLESPPSRAVSSLSFAFFRLQLQHGLFSYFVNYILPHLRKFTWFLIDFN